MPSRRSPRPIASARLRSSSTTSTRTSPPPSSQTVTAAGPGAKAQVSELVPPHAQLAAQGLADQVRTVRAAGVLQHIPGEADRTDGQRVAGDRREHDPAVGRTL